MSNLEEATEVKGQYGAGQIQVLEGLEAVRKRPSKYQTNSLFCLSSHFSNSIPFL